MESILHVNSAHLSYLMPLIRWRVLDLETLKMEAAETLGQNNFYRIIRNLEAKKILETYRDPFNRKKYVYLGKVGENELEVKDNPTSISKETLLHDIKVSELARAFLNDGLVEEVELEHQISDKRNFIVQYKIIPDALFSGARRGAAFNMALELELTRKNNQRILEKARQYLDSSFYNYALYFFSKERMRDQYIKLFTEQLGEESLGRFMFFSLPDLTGKSFAIEKAEGFFKGKKVNLLELFKGG